MLPKPLIVLMKEHCGLIMAYYGMPIKVCKSNGVIVLQVHLGSAMMSDREEFWFSFISMLMNCLRACKTESMVGDMLVNHLMYAEDLVVFTLRHWSPAAPICTD